MIDVKFNFDDVVNSPMVTLLVMSGRQKVRRG